jgi:hypothetical protein
MADIDMTDAPSGSTAPAKKAVGKGKAGAGSEGGQDGKKRFEVKKVSLRLETSDTSLIYITVECCCSLGLGHRRRQLRYLQKPHHGSLYVFKLATRGFD